MDEPLKEAGALLDEEEGQVADPARKRKKTPWSSVLFFQDLLYHSTELRENDRYRFPHQVIIDGKIGMGKFVPHPGNLAPGNFRVIACN